MYVSQDTDGCTPRSYLNEIRPQKSPVHTVTKQPVLLTEPPHLTGEVTTQQTIETATELSTELTATFAVIVKKSLEENGNVDQTFDEIEKDNNVTLSDKMKQEIERQALIQIGDDASKINTGETTTDQSVVQSKKITKRPPPKSRPPPKRSPPKN